MAKKEYPYGYDFLVLCDADDLAELYWGIQVEHDPNVHPELQDDPKKLHLTIQKWTKEFYKLLIKYHPPMAEVESVIRFVYTTKYYSKAKYSAGYLCSKYLAIRELMEQIEFKSFIPEFG